VWISQRRLSDGIKNPATNHSLFVLTEYLLFCFVYLCVLEKKWFCYVCLCFWIRIENHFWSRYAECVWFIDLVLIRIEPIGNHFDNKFQKWSNFLPLVSMIFSVWFPPVWLSYIYFFLFHFILTLLFYTKAHKQQPLHSIL
jgi:hypothetical protein